MTKSLAAPRATQTPAASSKRRGARMSAAGVVGALVLATFVGGTGATAFAATGDTSAGNTTANVGVSSSITLSAETPAFTLNGLPGATVTGNAAVALTVETNNAPGYTVTVQAAAATLTPAVVANPDSIPIANLGVRESAAGNTGPFTAVSSTATVQVHGQAVRSAAGGDAISNDYQIAIPFVASDTYSVALNYIATAS